MIKNRERITLLQLIITLLINGINIIFILFFVCYKFIFDFGSLKYLSNITLYFNTIYLFLSCLCDIYLFFFKSTKLEKLNYFLRYKFCNIINPISYLAFILFWILVIAGGIVRAFESPMKALFSIYANLLINIFIIIDLFINDLGLIYYLYYYIIFVT